MNIMVDYKEMYFNLAGAVANAIEILTDAQQKGEETYISAEDAPIKILNFKNEQDKEER